MYPPFVFFLVADTQLYKRLCPSVHRSVGPSVGRSVGEHESKSVKTRNSARAHPSATGGRVSSLVNCRLTTLRHFAHPSLCRSVHEHAFSPNRPQPVLAEYPALFFHHYPPLSGKMLIWAMRNIEKKLQSIEVLADGTPANESDLLDLIKDWCIGTTR